MCSVKRLTDFGWAFEGYFDFKVTHQTSAGVESTKMSLLSTAAPAIQRWEHLGGRCSRRGKQKLFFKASWHFEFIAFPNSQAVKAAFPPPGEREPVPLSLVQCPRSDAWNDIGSSAGELQHSHR